jgi:anti-sigma factor RsiW
VRLDELDADDLACDAIVELVSDYIDGGLDPDLADGFARHLAECPGCLAYLGQIRAVVERSHALHVDDLPAPVMDALLATFRDARNGLDDSG